MASENLVKTLGKVIIAAAWADGKVSPEEVNSLKDLLFRIPKLTALEWAELDIYIESPVSEAERNRLVTELQTYIANPADKALALETLDEVIQADGHITEDEHAIVQEIKRAIDDVDVSLIGQIGRLVRGPIQRRSAAVRKAPNREQYLEDYIKNKIYYSVQRRLELQDGSLNIPDDQLYRLSLAGGLMALVAHVNKEVTDTEVAAMVEILQRDWHISEQEAAIVAEVAADDSSAEMDYFRLAREFVSVCTPEALNEFLGALFAVAAADGMASRDEIEEIRNISRALKLTHDQFIQAKITIPRDKRAD